MSTLDFVKNRILYPFLYIDAEKAFYYPVFSEKNK